MLDIDRFKKFIEQVRYNEDQVYLPGIISEPETYANWDLVYECIKSPWLYDCRYLTKAETKEETIGAIKIKTAEDENAVTLKGQLEKDHALLITNFENASEPCKNLISTFMDLFYLDFDLHGVWPAQKGPRSGHAHLYCGSEKSNSFSPHCDAPHNFIVQIEGESEFITYKNRAFGLTDSSLLHELPLENRKEIMDSLEISNCYKLKPGDMVYVPSRQYHYMRPLTKRISISFPLMLKGPMAC